MKKEEIINLVLLVSVMAIIGTLLSEPIESPTGFSHKEGHPSPPPTPPTPSPPPSPPPANMN